MTKIRRAWRPQGRFLRVLARTCCVAAACRSSGVARRTAYRWRDEDADFRRRWDAAVGRGQERLREEAMERAMIGDERPVWHQGRVVGQVRVADNRALWRLMQRGEAVDVASLRSRRAADERATELDRRLRDSEKRMAAYEAGLLDEVRRTRMPGAGQPGYESRSEGDSFDRSKG